jgi:Ca2+/H+ antiporter
MRLQEHWTAVMGAYKDKLDLSISVAVGSSIQIAFVSGSAIVHFRNVTDLESYL